MHIMGRYFIFQSVYYAQLHMTLTPGNQNSSPLIESKVQSMVQSKVQSPGFVVTPPTHNAYPFHNTQSMNTSGPTKYNYSLATSTNTRKICIANSVIILSFAWLYCKNKTVILTQLLYMLSQLQI